MGRERFDIGVRAARAFSLVELLVVIAVLATIAGLLLPALGRSMAMARQFRCQVSLRSVGFDFGVFADEALHGDRGADKSLGPRFRVETFQESEYGIDEFWRWGDVNAHTVPDADDNDPMRCAAVKGLVMLRRGTPCRQGAVTPSENISYTFNGRLDRAPRGSNESRWMQATLTPDAASESMVPLAFDVDGAEAERRGVTPVFSAPGLGVDRGPFAGDALWFPSYRHAGSSNVLFTDQHVESSRALVDEKLWRWDFLPR